MYITHFRRSIIVIALTFTLLLGIFTHPVMAINEGNFSGSDIKELNTDLDRNESTQLLSKDLPFLQLGDGSINGAKDAVLLVQRILSKLGYFNGSIDGEFLDKTEQSVKNYQQRNGIEQIGKVDRITWRNLSFDVLSPIKSFPNSLQQEPDLQRCRPCSTN